MTDTLAPEKSGPPGGDADEADLARARKEHIGRYVAMILLPFVMVSMMITGYLAAMHSPAPNNMPIAVAGPAQQAEQFARALEDADPDAVDVRVVSGADAARDLVLAREVSGAVALAENGTATVYTAGAAGASQSSMVSGLLAPPVLGQGLDLVVEDLAPLPAHDTAGLAAMFMATALMLAGYMPLSVMLSNSPELLRIRRVVPLLAGWSALIAFLVWLVAGPVLGAVEGNTAAVLGISWLSVFAVGAVQLFLTRILGPMAVIAGMLFLMVLGVPASNMGMSVHALPGLYATLHGFLPTAATGEALRSALYFGGDGLGGHLLVLAVGALLALVATVGVDALKRRRNPDAGDPEITLPSLTAGPRPASNRVRYVTLAFFPLGMVVMMLSFMLGAMYQPAPRDMPVTVVAATTEQAEQVVAGLEENMTGLFALKASDSVDAARAAVQDRTAIAAYVLPSATSPTATLVTNEAAGVSQQQVVTTVFGQVAAGSQMPLTVENLAPLPGADSMGTVTLYVAMGWIMSGFMLVVVASSAQPAAMRLRRLLPIAAGWSVFMSAVIWVIADPIVGAVDGHFWQLFATGIVAIFSTALFTAVPARLFGLLAVLPAVAILMFLGVPASNGALSVYMTPEIFTTLHAVLPMPAAVESVRSILYFGGDTVGSHLVTFAIWGAASLVCVVVIDAVRARSAARKQAVDA
ncbi:ABC transporter permease [Rhodococcus sp. BL-253-APC-6A1W]|uniref:ABC transporter permease n=1 Tax=Rhodococcus sp. BL-253-APC-6A1W TaxID=2725307 RepID=UPI00146AF5FE|nr:ABC transporter permease [Rhodococcus sp. BL-253-APC-6A1W]NMD96251.1 ABC transporter permease [Rhodococcus sp. BL-253-APC-6A1W]